VTVVVADLGLGNLSSVVRAFERAGAEARVSSDAATIGGATHLVVPGQGHFGDAARALNGAIGDAVREHLARERPYLGICLGMQILFESSEEAPGVAGLGVVRGAVRRFARDRAGFKVPHMGWNQVRSSSDAFADGAWFYFVHSFYCDPVDRDLELATADHGVEFAAALSRAHVLACQFHPEKSDRAGADFLRGFVAA
jgi:imidazole glycerol phosphate synthase glutamine amidotransferase subunit